MLAGTDGVEADRSSDYQGSSKVFDQSSRVFWPTKHSSASLWQAKLCHVLEDGRSLVLGCFYFLSDGFMTRSMIRLITYTVVPRRQALVAQRKAGVHRQTDAGEINFRFHKWPQPHF